MSDRFDVGDVVDVITEARQGKVTESKRGTITTVYDHPFDPEDRGPIGWHDGALTVLFYDGSSLEVAERLAFNARLSPPAG